MTRSMNIFVWVLSVSIIILEEPYAIGTSVTFQSALTLGCNTYIVGQIIIMVTEEKKK